MTDESTKTIEETLVELLVEHGLFEAQAKEVMDALKADPAQEQMKGRWRDPASDYPKPMMVVLWMLAKRKAGEWIAKNIPKHWARPLFDGNLESLLAEKESE